MLYFLNQTGRVSTHIGMFPVLRMDVQGPLNQGMENYMQRLKGTVVIRTNFISISVLKYIFLFSKKFRHFIPYSCMGMKNWNNRNYLSLIESKNKLASYLI